MNLAPLLAELAGLKALPSSLLREEQRLRLETLRSSLALAQHVLHTPETGLPRLRLSTGDGVCEGTVIGHGEGQLLLRLPEQATPSLQGPALLLFGDGRAPLALSSEVTQGPGQGYWQVRVGHDATAALERHEERQTPSLAMAAILMPA